MMWFKPWAFHEKLPSISIPTGIRNCIFPPCTLSEEASYWAYLPSVMDQSRGMLLVENKRTDESCSCYNISNQITKLLARGLAKP